MVRKKVIAGNWKMEMSHKGELEVAKALKKLSHSQTWSNIDVVICPSYPSLAYIYEEFKNSAHFQIGAQNTHWEESGAWTGSTSISQISPFVTWCIVGHSEQRQLIGLSEKQIGQTAVNLLNHGINPIVCLGENLDQKENDQTIEVVTEQVENLLNFINRAMLPKLVIAYEPIWAISANNPGELPDPTDVAGTMLLIRKIVSAKYGNETAERMRIIYGGSVKPENIELYVREPGVDGALVGSASTHPRKFIEIISNVKQ